MAKRGRPRKHLSREDVKSAANAANRASRRRRKVATQSHGPVRTAAVSREDVRPTDSSALISTESVPAELLAPSRTITLISLASRPIKSETKRSPSLSRETCAAAVYDRAEITGRQYKATIEGLEALEGFAEEAFKLNPVETVDVAVKLADIMGFTRTLAVAKQGIRFNVTPHIISNLDSDIHLTLLTPTSNGRTRRVPLHMVPHYQFGRLVGYEDVTLYLFFPYLYKRRKANNYLNQDTLRRWTDRVLLPAIYSQASASILQHYPAGYEHSKLSSKAGHTEAHTRKDKSGVRH
ncbi:hypothetical protein BKA66DRAFT_555306 [Pyrenochaeta sp. MPI-SDFR-AT-0127]|nr:hypothetical protein BKA66DRAFT_555306 [Pyrenochaeta sp. MPI-SDFR-AT-0127]